MGNSPSSWRYYNLKRATRPGQDALQLMREWREGIAALQMCTDSDVEVETGGGGSGEDEYLC